MESRTARPFAFLLALAIGIGIGWLIPRPSDRVKPGPRTEPIPTEVALVPPTPTPVPRDYLIIVGPDAATLSEPMANIGWGNQIHWVSNEKQSLSIVFPVTGFPGTEKLPPFDDMKEVKQGSNDDWVFQHPSSPSTTASGTPSAALQKEQTAAHGTLEYKYDQILAGTRKDGRIIIRW